MTFFFAINVYALNGISLEKRDVDAIKQIGFSFKEKHIQMTKNTNQFEIDSSNEIGLYHLKYNENTQSFINKIKNLHSRLLKMNKHYKKMGKSFNQANLVGPHKKYIKLGKFIIPKGHKIYDKAYQYVEEILKKSNKKRIDTVKYLFNDKGPQLIFYNNAKQIKKESISLGFHCSRKTSFYLCPIKKYGVLQI